MQSLVNDKLQDEYSQALLGPNQLAATAAEIGPDELANNLKELLEKMDFVSFVPSAYVNSGCPKGYTSYLTAVTTTNARGLSAGRTVQQGNSTALIYENYCNSGKVNIVLCCIFSQQ